MGNRKQTMCFSLSEEKAEYLRAIAKSICGKDKGSLSNTLELLLHALQRGKIKEFMELTPLESPPKKKKSYEDLI